MRPSDTILAPAVLMSSWLRALQQAIADDHPEVPGGVLLPQAALDEVRLLARSPPAESPGDRASLQADVGAALGAIGPELNAAAAGAIADYQAQTLSRLPELSSTAEGLRVAAAASTALAARLADERSAAAAWRDVRASFHGDCDLQICVGHLAQLREILERRGHVWSAEAEAFARIINDAAWYAARAGGDVEALDDWELRYEARAGLDEQARLDLIERYAARPAEDERFTVWTVFFDAVLADDILDLGPIRLVDVRAVQKKLASEDRDLGPLGFPPGRKGEVLVAHLIEDVEADGQAVLARVETDARHGDAVEWAQGTLTAMLDVATIRMKRQLGWRLAEGHLLVSPDGGWSSRRLVRAGVPEMRRMLDRFIYRPEHELARLDPAVLAAWRADRDDAIDAVDIARWHASVRELPDSRFRVALSIRNLERALPRARLGSDAHWTAVARFYLKDEWCWARLGDELDDIRYQILSPPHEGGVEDHIDEIGPFYDALRRITGAETPTRQQVVEHAGKFAELMPEGSSRWRLLRRFERDVASPPATAAWLGRLGQEFDRLLARAARQRNAVLHGSRTSSYVIDNTIGFVDALSLQTINAALAAVSSGDALEVELERRRLVDNERSTAVRGATSLLEVVT